MKKTHRFAIYALVIFAGALAGALTPPSCRLCLKPSHTASAKPAHQAPVLAARVR